VLTLSSTLPALEGALESSNGEANGELPYRLSLLAVSESQLVLLEDIADTEREVGLSVGSSWYGLGGPRVREGGNSISEESATPGAPYIAVPGGGGRCGNRFLVAPGVPGTVPCELSDRMVSSTSPPLPELTVI